MQKCNWFVLWVSMLLATSTLAELPKRDFVIELRHTEEGRDASDGYRAGTGPSHSANGISQSLGVRNGEKATLRTQLAVPMLWVQSAQTQNTTVTAQAAATASSGVVGGVSQALHWFDVGQSITVTPKWQGGKKDVVLEIEVQQSDIKTVHNADLPQQERRHFSTTITVPINVWVTIAASGKAAAPAGSYSSEGAVDARRLLQVRLQTP